MLAMGILFYRWHNVIAARIQREHPAMSDEDVFQKARRIVIGTLQVNLFPKSNILKDPQILRS